MTVITDLDTLAEAIWANRYAGPTAHVVDEALDLARQVPPELRATVGLALVIVGRCLSEPDGVNVLGLAAAALMINPKEIR
jgi:hypothetical protein